jgi:glycerol-3-phosphate dehydrogenase
MTGRLAAVKKALKASGLAVEAREWRRSVLLEGRVDTWQQYIAAGYAAAGKGYKGVVNDIEVEGVRPQPGYLPPTQKGDLEGREFDIVIIGAGVIGCAVARELTRWNLTVALLEKEDDLAKQTSSRNNGMIHPGIAASYGSKKLDYNIRGNRMYSQAAAELGFKLNRCGSVVMLEKSWHRLGFPFVRHNALKKGVAGIELLSPREVKDREPNSTPQQRGGLFLPSTGVVAPYKVTIAYGENAVQNGAEVFLNAAVLGFELERGSIVGLRTNRGKIWPKVVVNAAGVWADRIAGFA